jgi:hypothetical protein
MSEEIFFKRISRLNNLLKKWPPTTQNKKNIDQIIEEIVFQYLAAQRSQFENHFDWNHEYRTLFNTKQLDLIFNYVTLDPIIELAKKGSKYLENNQIEKAREVFDELQNKEALISKIKSKIAKSDRKEHPIDDLILKELKNNPQIKLPMVKSKLKALEGKGTIIQWDDEENEILSNYEDGAEALTISITGLKDRFYDLRNKK